MSSLRVLLRLLGMLLAFGMITSVVLLCSAAVRFRSILMVLCRFVVLFLGHKSPVALATQHG